MSTIKSSTEHLTLNADGAGKEIKLQTNGVEVAKVTSDSVSLGDNVKAKFGNADDLQVYHDGSNSYITENSTGNLNIEGINIVLKRPGASTEKYVECNVNDSVDLYYDNSPKLATTSSGIDVTGDVRASGNGWTYGYAIFGYTALDGYNTGERSLTIYAGSSDHNSYMAARNVADITPVFKGMVGNDTKVRLQANGDGKCDGSWAGGGADYAEYFEWADGNPTDEDRVGMSVSLVGNQIKIAEEGDVVMGIVSARPALIGDSASLGWQGKFEIDEYGRRIQQDITVYSWGGEEVTDEDGNVTTTEKFEYRHDQIPEGVTVPDNATSVVRQEDKPSADYDADADYVPRSDRKEWSAIGLMGKLKLRTGQVTDSRWIKMRDVSDTVEEWLVR